MIREREREATGKTKTQTWSHNTYVLPRTTLELTIGCLCQGPSRRFQGACKFSTRKKKLARRSDSLVRVSRRVQRDHKKNACTRAGHRRRCSKWPPLARTHAKHLRMNPKVHAFSAAPATSLAASHAFPVGFLPSSSHWRS